MKRNNDVTRAGLVVAMLLALTGLGGCDYGKITLEDTHAAAWMVTENSFNDLGEVAVCEDSTKSWGSCSSYGYTGGDHSADAGASDPDASTSHYVHGVLFQMGNRVDEDGNVNRAETHFKKVSIEKRGSSTPIDIEPEDFDWLNLIEEGSPCPIDALHAYGMFENCVVETDCDCVNTDSCTVTSPRPPECEDCPDHDASETCERDCTADCDDNCDINRTCLRYRSIHASIQATRLITYWAPGHYSVETGETIESTGSTGTHNHVSYTFDLPSDFNVDVWKDGCLQTTYENVTDLIIHYQEIGSTHYGFDHPPMNGGTVTPK